MDAGRHEVHVGDEEIQLAPKEFDLLWELLDHRGLVLTRDQLLERVWGYTFAGDTRTVDVHVRQLRRKLGDASPIVTVWGVGYKVSPAQGPQKDPATPSEGAARALVAPRPAAARSSSRGIVLAGLVTTAIAVRLFQDFAHDQTVTELRREANGIAQLYSNAVQATYSNNPRRAPTFAAANLERATGDRIYFTASRARSRARSRACGSCDLSTIDWTSGDTLTFEFTPPGAKPDLSGGRRAGPLGKASRSARSWSRSRRPTSRERVRELVWRLAVAGALGLLVAGLLAWYLSRTIVRPVLALSRAADEVAGGQLRGRDPRGRRGRDRPPGRAVRRDDRAGSPRPSSASATSSCRSRTSCARR